MKIGDLRIFDFIENSLGHGFKGDFYEKAGENQSRNPESPVGGIYFQKYRRRIMKRSSRRWKKPRQMRWKWQRKKMKKKKRRARAAR